jgi:DNA topoisomerase-6 subunit B
MAARKKSAKQSAKKSSKKTAKQTTKAGGKRSSGTGSGKSSRNAKRGAGREQADQLGLTFERSAAAEKAPAEPKAKPAAAGKRRRRKGKGSIADRMAASQREISVSEFFTKNRHLLGFDNPTKALLTTVKEAVDNSLDACEEAKILPQLEIWIEELAENRFRVRVTDNGPGIVRAQIPKIFGKLLYGSKFHRLKQSRGQQGIGISAAGMYGQLTTGKPTIIVSRTSERRPAHRFEVKIDTRKNKPEASDTEVDWERPHGTEVELEIEASYRGGKRSVDQYIEQTAIANPHATFDYRTPKGEQQRYERLTDALPREPSEIKPHPHGVELGALMTMLRETRGRNLRGALMRDFSRVSERVAESICETAGLSPTARPKRLRADQVEVLHRAMSEVKVMNPPASCVVPIGEELIRKGLEHGVEADFFTSVTRAPSVYRGNPFQVEAGLAWGGGLPSDELCRLYRFANRVPLQYQQSDCAITKAVIDTDWRNYRVSQSRGALPAGPMVILVHVASVWVPFTSESKEAVARYPEMLREIRLAVQTCGRRLARYLSARRREAEEGRKRDYIETYIPHIGLALREILDLSKTREERLVELLKDTLRRSRKFK